MAAYVGHSLIFLLSTSSPAEPLDTTGGTLRFRRTPVEQVTCSASAPEAKALWRSAIVSLLLVLLLLLFIIHDDDDDDDDDDAVNS